MSDVSINYKGEEIASMSEAGTKTLETEGKYCEDNIEVVYSGGLDTSDATAAAGDILSGKTAYVDGEKITGTIATKTSSDLTASGATVTVPAGYYASQATGSVATGSATAPSSISGSSATVSTGTNTLTLSKTVSVTPSVSAGYVSSGTAGNSSVSLTASVTTKAAATITPTTSNQTIAAGTYLTEAQTIKGDTNLVAGNIKSGVSIFGVSGSYDPVSSLKTALDGHIIDSASGSRASFRYCASNMPVKKLVVSISSSNGCTECSIIQGGANLLSVADVYTCGGGDNGHDKAVGTTLNLTKVNRPFTFDGEHTYSRTASNWQDFAFKSPLLPAGKYYSYIGSTGADCRETTYVIDENNKILTKVGKAAPGGNRYYVITLTEPSYILNYWQKRSTSDTLVKFVFPSLSTSRYLDSVSKWVVCNNTVNTITFPAEVGTVYDGTLTIYDDGTAALDTGGIITTFIATQISTLLGENNIWADIGNVSVECSADTILWIDAQT